MSHHTYCFEFVFKLLSGNFSTFLGSQLFLVAKQVILWGSHPAPVPLLLLRASQVDSCSLLPNREVKRNNGVFIIPLFLLKNFRYSNIPAQTFSLFHYSCSNIFVIPLFLLKHFPYSIVPAQKFSLFHYSSKKSTHYSVIPRTKFPLFLRNYSSSAPNSQQIFFLF